jgi:transcriptional regulator with XRE-family HTH domain
MAGIDPTNLQVFREKERLSKVALAELAGISLSYYCDIEAGRRTLKRNPALIGRLADALNIPVSTIEARRAA